MKNDESGAADGRTVYEFDDFRVDAGRRLLTRRDGTPVPLTSRVFDTLLELVRRAGNLVDKRELMRAVWGDAVVEENNLTQSISALRQALGEQPGDHRYVVTVPGRGYRFIAEVRTPAASGPRSPTDPPAEKQPFTKVAAAPGGGRRFGLLALTAAVVGVIAFLLLRSWPVGEPVTQVVAILPFSPLVAESSDPALELGMADTLITRLSNTAGLVVRPLSSTRRYAGLDKDPVEVGRALGADIVLEGSVYRAGEALRVSVRLVRVRDGTALWADQIDQGWTDIFAVQDRIAERIVGALAVRLSQAERSRLTRRDTENGEAYRLYTLGRYHFLKLVPPEIDKGIAYFRQAIDADPAYAAAYAGLAESYRALAITSDQPPAEVLPVGKEAALKAIELDGQLEPAVASLCFIQTWWDWDWSAAEQSCRHALDLNPDSPDGHRAYAVLLSDLGRHGEAIRHARRAAELEPLSLITRAIEGHVLLYAGRTDDARKSLNAALEMDDRFWIARLFLGKTLLAQGDFPGAIAEFERARDLSGANSETVSMIGYTAARMRDSKRAEAALAELLSRPPARYVPPLNVAMIYNGLGKRDQAFEWLDKAVREHDVRLTFLKVDRRWDALRDDPRFDALLARLKLG